MPEYEKTPTSEGLLSITSVCQSCGAIVWNRALHDAHHVANDKATFELTDRQASDYA